MNEDKDKENIINKIEGILSGIINAIEELFDKDGREIKTTANKYENISKDWELSQEINIFNRDINYLIKMNTELEIFERINVFIKNISIIVYEMFEREDLGEIYMLFPGMATIIKEIWGQKLKEKENNLEKLKREIIVEIITNMVSHLFVNFNNYDEKLILKETKNYFYL